MIGVDVIDLRQCRDLIGHRDRQIVQTNIFAQRYAVRAGLGDDVIADIMDIAGRGAGAAAWAIVQLARHQRNF